jgi:hypothetical protein
MVNEAVEAGIEFAASRQDAGDGVVWFVTDSSVVNDGFFEVVEWELDRSRFVIFTQGQAPLIRTLREQYPPNENWNAKSWSYVIHDTGDWNEMLRQQITTEFHELYPTSQGWTVQDR